MSAVKGDDGKKHHVCDDDCMRICPHCQGEFLVHGMWRYGMQTFRSEINPDGGEGHGGLLCNDCAGEVISFIHGGGTLT